MASAWSQLDQLLTCAICLDRYRNPKLLPCQHTFCMEPCLDGLIDYARRQIKCPECRAEHRIPYQGIQQFPTNVTLMRFLELHRDITGEEPEPPPSLMERCNVCSEKSNVERCAHCEKKICPDCKEAHVDILRREINRINNQVRRGLHRLSEALTQTKKNAEKLQINCKQVKEEIDDIVKRYSKDIKVTEDRLKHDLEVYTQTEMKAIAKLKEDLEIEVNNISSNCELVDKYIKDDYEWSDVELLEYKQIFLKMLDFLRTFDPDNTDFTRRIKFQPRADPDVLHRNIADFGELKINAPMNSIPTQQSLMPPTSNALMRSQSDHRLAAQFARRCSNTYSDSNQRIDSERPTSPLLGRNRRDNDSGYRRYSERSRDYDYNDRVSSRYSSREDTALSSRWRDGGDDYSHRNRYNRDYEESDSEPHQSRTVRFADEPQQQRESLFNLDEASKGPLSGVVKLLDSPKVMERLHQNEVKQKVSQNETTNTDVTPSPPVVPSPAVTQQKRPTSRQQSEDDIDRQKRANQQASSSTSSTTSPSNTQTDISTNVESRRGSIVDTTESVVSPRPLQDSSESSDSLRNRRRLSGTSSFDEQPATENNTRTPSRFSRSPLVKAASLDAGDSSRKPLDKRTLPRAATPLRQNDSDESDEEDEDEEEYQIASEPPKPVQSSFFGRQRRLPEPEPRLLEMHETESDEESESEEEEDEEEETPIQAKTIVNPPQNNPVVQNDEDEDDEEEEEEEEDDDEDESSSSSANENESRDSEDHVLQNSNMTSSTSEKQSLPHSTDSGYKSSKVQLSDSYESESDDQNAPNLKESDEVDDSEEEEGDFGSNDITTVPRNKVSINIDPNLTYRGRKRSDDTDTTDSSSASINNDNPLVESTNNQVAEERISSEGSSNDSTPSRFRRRPFLARSRSSHEIGLGIDTSLCADDDEEEDDEPPTNYRSRSKRMSEDNGRTRPSDLETSTTSNNCWANYLNNKYGSNATGRVVPRSKSSHSLYQKSDMDSSDDDTHSGPVLSSSYAFASPRSTYMQKRRMFMKIGSRGSEPGQFTWPRAVAVGPDNSIVVADSSNHRIQVFDSIGKFSFEFGTYGSGDGEFDCLAGVSVNRIGQFIVSDRYNYRVQLFDPTGRFLRAFGCEGRTDGRFNYPWGIATDSLGFIYVCDKENHRIQVFQSDGTFVGKFGSMGSRPGQLEHPHYIAVTNTNRVVVTDTNNHRVQIFDVNGRSLTTFGSEGSSDGQFKFPKGIAVDDQGYILVGDSGNNRVQIFQPDGTFLRSFGTWGTGDGEFKGLEGLAVSSGGSIIACDRENHRIQVF